MHSQNNIERFAGKLKPMQDSELCIGFIESIDNLKIYATVKVLNC